jgi:hypothetical protein
VIFLNSQAWCPMAAILTTEELHARWAWICHQLRKSYLSLWRFYLKNKTLKKLSGVMALLECLHSSCNQSPVLQKIKIKVPRKMSYRKSKFLIHQLYLLLPSLQFLIQSWAAWLLLYFSHIIPHLTTVFLKHEFLYLFFTKISPIKTTYKIITSSETKYNVSPKKWQK